MPGCRTGGLGADPLGEWELGGGGGTIEDAIDGPISDVFRRAYIQRRLLSTGQFDGVWREITTYVKRWGTFESSLDDVRLNTFRNSGANLTVTNDTGAFNRENNFNSLWSGYLGRYRTLLRINAGYLCGTSELPATSTVGIFVLDDEISIRTDSNDVSLRAASLKSIFDEVNARYIAGLSGPQTAEGLIVRIRDHTDGAGGFVFRSFITSTAWTIQSTSNNYFLNTDTTLSGKNTWELMQQLAEAEGFVVLINRSGGLEFRNRTARTTTSQFSFFGQGFGRQHIIAITDYKEAINKYFNFFRLKYLEADTATSFVSAGTSTAINSSNPSWLFGHRQYDFENLFVSGTTTAQNIVNSLFTTFGTMTTEVEAKTVFVPQIELLDRIDFSYRSYDLAASTIWDTFDWGPATGATGATWSVEGENFDWLNRANVVLSRSLNLDNFTMTYKTRELV